MNNIRSLTPYEKNQLIKYEISEEKLLETDAPVEYITGYVEFMRSEFNVSPKVLIPRIETEELVEMAVEAVVKMTTEKILQVVDVGTGSGAIAISVAKKLKEKDLGTSFEVVGLDISEDALAVAKKNLNKINGEISNLNKKLPVKFIKSDLLGGLYSDKNQNNEEKVDLVIANLPYIPSSRIKNLDNSVKNFEPHLALDGGADGLDLVRKLLKQTESILSKNGIVLLELDITHTQEKMQEFKNDWKVKIIKSKYDGVNFGKITKIS